MAVRCRPEALKGLRYVTVGVLLYDAEILGSHSAVEPSMCKAWGLRENIQTNKQNCQACQYTPII